MEKRLRSRREKDEGEETSRLERLCKDVLVDVLLRLNVKTLAKCRCVSKTLNRAISDPGFVDMHRHQSMFRSSSLLFIDIVSEQAKLDLRRNCPDIWTFSIADHTQMDSEGRPAEGEDIYSSCIDEGGLSVEQEHVLFSAGYCDLLCLRTGYDIHLCNPRTGEAHTLPKRSRSRSSKTFEDVAFGYLPSKREYIVVNLSSDIIYHDLKRRRRAGFTRAYKFSFASNGSLSSSTWEDVEDACPCYGFGGILINNFIYWEAISYEDRRNKFILSLDVEKDKFGTVKCPPNSTFDSNCITTLTMIDLKGTLCVLDGNTLCESNVLQLWAFKSNSCWVKEFSIKLDFQVATHWVLYKGAWFSRDGDIILPSPVSGKYYLFNLEKRSVRVVLNPHPVDAIRHLHPIGLVSNSLHVFARFYWESFLSFQS